MASESRARNRGSIVDEEELMFQETQDFKDRVQNRIDELQKVKDALNWSCHLRFELVRVRHHRRVILTFSEISILFLAVKISFFHALGHLPIWSCLFSGRFLWEVFVSSPGCDSFFSFVGVVSVVNAQFWLQITPLSLLYASLYTFSESSSITFFACWHVMSDGTCGLFQFRLQPGKHQMIHPGAFVFLFELAS
jgi:hypothetical protein